MVIFCLAEAWQLPCFQKALVTQASVFAQVASELASSHAGQMLRIPDWFYIQHLIAEIKDSHLAFVDIL
jgi:hypothetical protein